MGILYIHIYFLSKRKFHRFFQNSRHGVNRIYRPFQLDIYRSRVTDTLRNPAFFARDVTRNANYSASVHHAHNLPSCIAGLFHAYAIHVITP